MKVFPENIYKYFVISNSFYSIPIVNNGSQILTGHQSLSNGNIFDLNNNHQAYSTDTNSINNQNLVKMDEENQNVIIDIFPRKKEARFYDVSIVGRVFVFIILFELLEVLTLIFMTITSWYNYILLYLYVSIFLLYFAINSVLNENKYQLFSFIIVNTVVSFIEIYQYLSSGDLREIYNFVRIISNIIFIPLNIILGYYTYKHFGWRLYRKIGTNIELRRFYKIYQVFLSFLKLDIFFSGLTFGCYSLFFVKYPYEHYINATCFLITLFWVFIGFIASRDESPPLIWIFLGMSWLTSSYSGYKTYNLINQIIVKIEPYNMGIPIITFSLVSILIRILVDIYSIRVYRNFYQGLKVVFEKEKKNWSVFGI